ncbi:MAG: hypothetical protein WCK11_00780 [Candidatus Falkowbacteria bacterium]
MKKILALVLICIIFPFQVFGANNPNETKLIIASGKDLSGLLNSIKVKRNEKLQKEIMNKYTQVLIGKKKITQEQKYTINNFITYGTGSTKKLTTLQRSEMVKKFTLKNNRLPISENDWTIIIDTKASSNKTGAISSTVYFNAEYKIQFTHPEKWNVLDHKPGLGSIIITPISYNDRISSDKFNPLGVEIIQFGNNYKAGDAIKSLALKYPKYIERFKKDYTASGAKFIESREVIDGVKMNKISVTDGSIKYYSTLDSPPIYQAVGDVEQYDFVYNEKLYRILLICPSANNDQKVVLNKIINSIKFIK